jgi:nucleoid-associated protein YgaU
MSDPFVSNSKSQLLREAQIGLSLVAILLILFVYVAYYRISGQGSRIPSHVHLAPVAQSIWPYAQAPEHASKQAGSLEAVTPGQTTAIERPEFDTNPAVPAARVEAFRLKQGQTAVAVATHVEPEVTIPNPPETASVGPRTRDTIPPKIDKSESSKPKRIASDSVFAVPEKLIAHNSEMPKQSHVVDDPFVQKSQPVNKTIENFRTNSDQQIGSKVIEQSSPAFNPDNSFLPKSATNMAVADPDMVCPKPIVKSLPATGLGTPKIGTDSIQINQLRSVSSPAELDSASRPLETTTDFSTANPAVKSDAAGDFRPEPSSFGAQASFYEKLSQSVPEPDLLTSPQKIPGSEPSLETHAKLGSVNESVRSSPDRPVQPEAISAVYQIKPGDSFWTIAQLRYGDGRFFRALYLYNEKNVISFENLPAGTRIDTPSRLVLNRLWPEHCPALKSQSIANEDFSYHVTQDGDTLFGIAAQRLGQASRYLEIQELNSRRLPRGVNHLTPLRAGIHVLLPAAELN